MFLTPEDQAPKRVFVIGDGVFPSSNSQRVEKITSAGGGQPGRKKSTRTYSWTGLANSINFGTDTDGRHFPESEFSTYALERVSFTEK
jgi:hypothetical protein